VGELGVIHLVRAVDDETNDRPQACRASLNLVGVEGNSLRACNRRRSTRGSRSPSGGTSVVADGNCAPAAVGALGSTVTTGTTGGNVSGSHLANRHLHVAGVARNNRPARTTFAPRNSTLTAPVVVPALVVRGGALLVLVAVVRVVAALLCFVVTAVIVAVVTVAPTVVAVGAVVSSLTAAIILSCPAVPVIVVRAPPTALHSAGSLIVIGRPALGGVTFAFRTTVGPRKETNIVRAAAAEVLSGSAPGDRAIAAAVADGAPELSRHAIARDQHDQNGKVSAGQLE
jgi:hypothetical protein